LSELTFKMSSTDPGNSLGFAGIFTAGDVYSQNRVGVVFNGTNPPTFITSGSADQPVNELLYVGVGNAFDNTQCPGADQSTLNCVAGQFDAISPFSVTTQYTLTDPNNNVLATGNATVDFVAPEPGTIALMMGGLGAVLLFARRRVA
jgi:hypothetical protein